MNKRKILAIIPARSGSKSIKNKNIVKVAGKPLIWYTIKPALKVMKKGIIDKLVVSTDSSRIAQVAEGLGIEVPFLRPKHLAKDNSKTVDVILHAINYYEKKGVYFDAIILLQPTSPLRKYADIEIPLRLFWRNKIPSLISVYKEEGLKADILYKRAGGAIAAPLDRSHNMGKRRQDSCSVYIRNGAIYITRVSYLKRHRKMISNRPLIFEMGRQSSLNVNTGNDLKELKRIYAKNK